MLGVEEPWGRQFYHEFEHVVPPVVSLSIDVVADGSADKDDGGDGDDKDDGREITIRSEYWNVGGGLGELLYCK